jgi:hypothetical protein
MWRFVSLCCGAQLRIQQQVEVDAPVLRAVLAQGGHVSSGRGRRHQLIPAARHCRRVFGRRQRT